MIWSSASVFVGLLASLLPLNGVVAQVVGSHTNLNRWCGKPYQAGSPNYNPGGQTHPPPASPTPLLHLQVQPRYNIYVDTERTGSFLVSTEFSNYYGASYAGGNSSNTKLRFDITVKHTKQVLVSGTIPVNASKTEFKFKLSEVEASMEGYQILLEAFSKTEKFTATTELFYLPDKTTGSVTKLDNLYGGMLFKNKASKYKFEPLFGLGFYTNYGGFLAQNASAIQEYYDAGFRTIHPIATYDQPSSPPYNPLNLSQVWDEADALDLKWVYDMRGVFQNSTQVAIEVEAHKDRETLYMWYTADEPDGWQYNLTWAQDAYKTIRSLDLYHPVGLVLNCYDFYFKGYSAGADIIMEDAYPISINSTFSYTWGIPCNSTYGDCGCDDCHGVIQDVSDRLDALAQYQIDLGQQAKPLYAVTQSFSDGEYWPRIPTPQETWAMNGIALNHNAKSFQSWTYPTDESVVKAQAKYAAVVTTQPVLGFLTGANAIPITTPEFPKLDVSYWDLGERVLFSFVNGDNFTVNGPINVEIPFINYFSYIGAQPWNPSDSWSLDENILSTGPLSALEHRMVILHR